MTTSQPNISLDLSAVPKEGRLHILEARSRLESAKGYAKDQNILDSLAMLDQMDTALKEYGDATGGLDPDYEWLASGETKQSIHIFRQELRKAQICSNWQEVLSNEGTIDVREASCLLEISEEFMKDYNFAEQDPEREFLYSWLGDGVTKDLFVQKLQKLRIERAKLNWEQAWDCYEEDPEEALILLDDLEMVIGNYNETARAEAFNFSWLGNDPETGEPITEAFVQAFGDHVQEAMEAIEEAEASPKEAIARKLPSLMS